MTTITPRISPIYVEVYDGEAGETVRLARLPIASIAIPDFQRDRKPYHKRIAAEYDRTAYTFPIVMDYKARYLALDGQQRLAGAAVTGIVDEVVTLIEGVASDQRAAELYLRYNRDRRGLNAFEKFIGAHAARDAGTLEIANILERCGLRAGQSATSFDAVPAGAVTSIHATYGPDVLARVLEIRELAWGDANDRESRESRTLRGLATFMRSYFEKVDDNILVDVLRKQHPAALLNKLDGKASGSFESRYSDSIRTLYNRRFPRGKGRL